MNNKKEIFVVFGKELKNDRITFEYKDRIDCLIDNLGMMGYLSDTENIMPNGSRILFTGGQKTNNIFTEARLGQSYFETKLMNNGLVSPTIELDLEAKNTIENIENILKILKNEENCFLYLISTDYHIKRLERIHRLLPKNVSLLAKIDSHGIKYSPLSCLYRYSSHNDEIKRWQAQLYLDSENFKIMESNLISIVNGKVNELSIPVVDYFHENLKKIKETFGTMLGSKRPRNDKVDEIIDIVYPLLSELSYFYIDLIKFTNKSNNTKKPNEWKLRCDNFNKNLREIIVEVDPDEPFSNGLL